MNDIEDVRILSLQPADVLVVRVKVPLSVADRERHRANLINFLGAAGIKNKVVVLDGRDLDLEVVRPDDEAIARVFQEGVRNNRWGLLDFIRSCLGT